ncbi:MAG: hypothetical protein LBM69_09400, partial [Lachnospiraceae bacterium]|nr:hypothetical protein [Lachnospiraceae bacterium]
MAVLRNNEDISTQQKSITDYPKEDSPTLQAQRDEYLKLLATLRLMDNDFFSEVLDGKKEAVEFIIQTILGR